MYLYVKSILLISLFSFSLQFNVLAQTIADCVGAVTICETEYSYEDPLSGNGAENPGFSLWNSNNNQPIFSSNGTPCSQGGADIIPTVGQAWYYFQVHESGQLCVSIVPESGAAAADYDWVVFNVTGMTCEDVANDQSLIVECNFGTAITGDNVTGPNGLGGSQSEPCLDVQVGEEYMIFVSRNSGASDDGFTIQIDNTSTADIIDNVNPEIESITEPVSCNATSFELNFSEMIPCSSVEDLDFVLTGPSGQDVVISNVYAQDCVDGINNRSESFIVEVPSGLSPAGEYTLEVTGIITDMCDNPVLNGLISFNIDAVLSASVTTAPTYCEGSSGSAEVTPSGATGTVNYSWSDGSIGNTNVANNLDEGTYYVTLSDNSGCDIVQEVIIEKEEPDLIADISTVSAYCTGNSGSATVNNVQNGVDPLTYNWSNGDTDANLNSVSAGNYTVTILDANQCQLVEEVEISADQPNLALEVDITDAICTSASGSANITGVSNSSPPLTYSWSNGDTDANLNNVAANVYTVTVQDNNQCELIENITIGTTIPQLTIEAAIVDAICTSMSGNATIAQVANATPPLNYNWNITNGATATDNELTNAPEGTYPVTITDYNGCTLEESIEIGVNNVQIDAVINTQPALCSSPSGSAEVVSVNNGTAPYSYSWSNGGTNDPVIDNLIAETYNVIITDDNGCTTEEQFVVEAAEDPTLEISVADISHVTCFGLNDGFAEVTSQGGTGVHEYSWSQPSITGNSYDQFFAGNYTVYVSDGNGCIDSVLITINQPDQLSISINIQDTTICDGGSVTLNSSVSGGVGAYDYQWLDSSSGSDAGTTPSVTVTPTEQTTYLLLVVDENLCDIQINATTVSIFPPISLNIPGNYEICDGDQVTISTEVTGGNGDYYYLWDNGSTDATITVSPASNTSYSVTVSNGPDCSTPEANDFIEVEVSEKADVNFTANIFEGCPPLEVEFEVIDYDPNYTYNWSYGNGFIQSTQESSVTNLYTESGCQNVKLEITTANGCKSNKSQMCMINVFETPNPDFAYLPSNPTNLSPQVEFVDLTKDASIRNWTINELDVFTDSIFKYDFPDAGEFNVLLVVTNEEGCMDSLLSKVFVDYETVIYVPSAFTPNQDDHNQEFGPIGEGIRTDVFEMVIIDRWGEEVFRTNDFYTKWNGRFNNTEHVCEQGVYSYTITYKNYLKKVKNIMGMVTLLNPVN